MFRTILAAIFVFQVAPARAQDTRHVAEPVIPKSCTILAAQLKADGKTLDAADEAKADTARIQAALDHCASGQAVELRASGDRNAFLSGPIQLRAGVTLRVDGG